MIWTYLTCLLISFNVFICEPPLDIDIVHAGADVIIDWEENPTLSKYRIIYKKQNWSLWRAHVVNQNYVWVTNPGAGHYLIAIQGFCEETETWTELSEIQTLNF